MSRFADTRAQMNRRNGVTAHDRAAQIQNVNVELLAGSFKIDIAIKGNDHASTYAKRCRRVIANDAAAKICAVSDEPLAGSLKIGFRAQERSRTCPARSDRGRLVSLDETAEEVGIVRSKGLANAAEVDVGTQGGAGAVVADADG